MFAKVAEDESISRAATGLSERNYTTHVADTVADARALVRDLLPRDKAIFTANSETVRISGLQADVDEGDEFVSVRAQLSGLPHLMLFMVAPQVHELEVQAALGDPVPLDLVAETPGARFFLADFDGSTQGFGYIAWDASGNVLVQAIT